MNVRVPLMRIGHFRMLVVASWGLYVIYWFYAYLPLWMTPYLTWLGSYDSQVVAIMRADGYAALFDLPSLVSVVLFWGWLFAAVGVFFLQNWGRYLYLALLPVGFIQLAVSGMVTLTPFQAVVVGIVNVIDGAVLAIAFLSPFNAYFSERRAPLIVNGQGAMRELLRFYLLHKNGDVRRSRNVAAASIVFFLIFGYGFGAAFLFAWVLRVLLHGWLDLWPLALAIGLVITATAVSHIFYPRALRVHRILEKYKDPVVYENELFASFDQDVATALLYDSFGKTDLAVMKLKVAVEVNPSNRQAKHLLMMIGERDGIPMENAGTLGPL